MAVQHLRKLISLFYKDYSDKPTATFKAINTAPSIDRPIVKPIAIIEFIKQKQVQLATNTNKQAKKN